MSPKQTALRKAIAGLYTDVPFATAKTIDQAVTEANGELKALNALLLKACKSAIKVMPPSGARDELLDAIEAAEKLA